MPLQQSSPEIVLTGPESSGKTALAQALATHFGEEWAPEFSRSYLLNLGRNYQREDLARIAAGQRAWQNWYTGCGARFFDTDWTVLQVWEHFRFEPAGPLALEQTPHYAWRKGWPDHSPAALYLLCAPDFPWEPDPLREDPEARPALFALYEKLLNGIGARYLVVGGALENRLAKALSAIREL